MAENRTQFTFYDSFYRAVRRIKKASDRAMAYDAICAYALTGEEPDIDSMSDSVAIVFEMIKPNLDASRRKAESGKRGGARKQTASKQDANCKQEKEQEKEQDKDKEQMLSPKPPRHKYGKYANVLLSDEDLDKLKAEFPDWETRIDRLSEYIASKGAKYKDHLATIRSWARKDNEQTQRAVYQQPKSGGDRLLEMIRSGVLEE